MKVKGFNYLISFLLIIVFSVLGVGLLPAWAQVTWTTKAQMPEPRSGSGISVLNGKIYVVGGQDSNGGPTLTLYEYDPATNTWATKAPMPDSYYTTAATAVNNRIYAIGGLRWGAWFSNQTREYNFVTDSWTAKAPMPTGRDTEVVTVNGKIYAIGGWAGWGPGGGEWRSEVEEYDPGTDTWTAKAPMPTARAKHSLAVVNGKIYAIGGWTSISYGPNIVEEYDSATNSWTTKAPMPTGRAELATVVVNNKIYAIGGGGVYSELATVEVYDPATDTWVAETSIPTARWELAAAVVKNKIYAMGGQNGYYNRLSTNEEGTGPVGMGKIAFASKRDDPNWPSVYIMNGDGSNQTKLTNNDGAYSPAISPDGRKIVFSSWRDGNIEVYIMNTDGSNQTRLTNSGASDQYPSISPDGNKIAWSVNGVGMYVMNVDGSNKTQLTFPPTGSWDEYPAFSPDGSKIVFCRNYQIYIMNADGSSQTQLTYTGTNTYVTFSPDGSKIAFIRLTISPLTQEIWTMNPDGSNQSQLTTNSMVDLYSRITYSPDGSKIIFMSNDFGSTDYEIYTINSDGAGKTALTVNSVDDMAPFWGPEVTTFVSYYCDNDNDGYIDSSIDGTCIGSGCIPAGCRAAAGNDCNDNDPVVNLGATEICDGKDNNCDGLIDEGVLTTYYRDADGDRYGNPALSTQACTAPAGYVPDNTDCDDNNLTINPGAPEICNDIDDNCNGQIDEGVQNTYYRDADGDGYGNSSISTQACTQLVGYTTNNTDCDDSNAAINPGVTEGPYGNATCSDGKDNNCNGKTDALDPNCTAVCIDKDGDGYGVSGAPCPKGTAIDCDDNNPKTYPGAPRICDGKDNDCDGRIDFSTDVDKDKDGYAICAGDCNDNDPTVHPGAKEGPYGDPTCSDGKDNNCNGKKDSTEPACYISCVDKDGDGYGNPGSPYCPKGAATDCNDNNRNIHPGALDNNCNGIDEDCNGIADDGYVPTPSTCGVGACAATGQNICQNGAIVNNCIPKALQTEGPNGDLTCTDGLDNDCDGLTDAADGNCAAGCIDNDSDGYGTNGSPACPNGPAIDCDDNNLNINPGASDANCNGIDENCNGTPDDDYVPTPTTCGVGICAATGQNICQNGTVVNICTPGAPQTEGPYGNATCSDGKDNNCNGKTDALDPNCAAVCIDKDGDGYGVSGAPCPKGTAIDCDDNNPKTYPGAPRICDGKDNDCDGRIDFSTDVDKDHDGYPVCVSAWGADCNDNDPTVHPGAKEGPYGDPTCSDGKDNNCNGKNDARDPNCASM